MGPLISNFFLPLAPLAYSAEFHIYGNGYRLETEPLLKSGICFSSESAGLKLCFPDDGSVELDLINPKLRRFIRPGSFLADLSEGPQVVSPGQAEFFFGTPMDEAWKIHYLPGFQWINMLETDVPAESDAHREILRRGFAEAETLYSGFEGAVLFYENDPAAFSTMALGNAYRDHPPTSLATIVDFVLRVFDPLLGTIHHGMAAFVIDSPDGVPRLQRPEETNQMIRGEVEKHLIEIARLKGERDQLRQENPSDLFGEEKYLQDYQKDVESVKVALDAGRLDEVQRWLDGYREFGVYPAMKDVEFGNWDRESAAMESGIFEYVRENLTFEDSTNDPGLAVEQMESRLSDYLHAFHVAQRALKAGQMAEVRRLICRYPELGLHFSITDVGDRNRYRYPREKVLRYLLRRHLAVSDYFARALELFDTAQGLMMEGVDPDLAWEAFNEGVYHYKEGLRYIPEAVWGRMAQGLGPIISMGQLHQEALAHLVSDAVGAHCQLYSGDACAQFLSANYFGLPPTHADDDDLLLDEYDNERPQNRKAVEATADILLYGVLNPDPLMMALERQRILDRFWPVAIELPEIPDGGIPPSGGVDAPDAGVNRQDDSIK